jgi:hypothetical protein
VSGRGTDYEVRGNGRDFGDRRGAFGCNAAGGAIVTLEWVSAPGAKPPRRVAVECCPHCNEPHPVVAVMWRKPTERDADREPDLILIGVTPEPEPQR